MFTFIRIIFYSTIVKFFSYFFIGLNIHNKENLPKGPSVIVANHNSHLDTLIIISLFKSKDIPKVKAVGAADYFFKNKILAFFSKNLIGVIPIERKKKSSDILDGIYNALDEGNIVIIFPEGTRGTKEKLAPFKNGISKIAMKYPDIPFVPIILSGLRRSLPKGKFLIVPFVTNVYIEKSHYFNKNRVEFIQSLYSTFKEMLDKEKNI